jgi:hypothetical protein
MEACSCGVILGYDLFLKRLRGTRQMSVRMSGLHTQNLKNTTFQCYPLNGKLRTQLVLEHILRRHFKIALCDVTVAVNQQHLTCSIGTISLLEFTAFLVTVPFCWADCSILVAEFW